MDTIICRNFNGEHVSRIVYFSQRQKNYSCSFMKMADKDQFTDVDLSCMLSTTFSIVSITINVIVCTATIFGNILILISIYKHPTHFKGSLYMFIGNLAVSDLLLGLWLLLLIYEDIDPELGQNWYFCVAKPVGILISYCCSIFSLLGISIDRFMAVMFPLKHLIKTHKRKFFITSLTIIWIISIVTGTLPVIMPNLTPSRDTFICRMSVILPLDFHLASSIALLLVVFVNFSLYGIVMWKIKTKETPGNSNRRKNETKTVLMIIVFVLFVVCWLPFIICSFIMHADLAPSTFQHVVCAREYLAKLGFVNSSLNWVIYGLANSKFRTAFRKILFCKCCTFLLKPSSTLAQGIGAKAVCNETERAVAPKQNETKI